MPSSCIMPGCETKYRSNDVSFHKFPFNHPKLLSQWIEFANRGPYWTPTKWSALCSSHFSKSDYRNNLYRKVLKKTAIPSITTTLNSLPTYENDNRNNQNEVSNNNELTETDINISNEIDVICRFCGTIFGDNQKLKDYFNENFSYLNNFIRSTITNFYRGDGLPSNICEDCCTLVEHFEIFLINCHKNQKIFEEKYLNFDGADISDNGNHSCSNSNNSNDNHNNIELDLLKNDSKIININKLKIKQEPITVIKEEILEPSQRFITSELLIGQSLSNNDVIEVTLPNDIINIIEEEPNHTTVEDEFEPELKCEDHNFYEESEKILTKRTNELKIENTHNYYETSLTHLNDHSYSKLLFKNSLNEENKPVLIYPTCHICNSYFEEADQLDKHVSSFHSFVCHTCNVCLLEFKTLFDYLMHKNEEHLTIRVDDEQQNNIISINESRGKNKNVKSKQIKSKTSGYSCPNCRLKIPSKTALNNHQKYLCKFKKLHCRYCESFFASVKLLKLHCREFHKMKFLQNLKLLKNIQIKKNVYKTDNYGRYVCKICSRSYSRRSNLLKHIRLHRPIDQWNLKCEYCGMLFDKIYDLNRHCRVGNCLLSKNESNVCKKSFYVCPICNQVLSSKRNLKIHQHNHNMELEPSNLYQHSKSHPDKKSHRDSSLNYSTRSIT